MTEPELRKVRLPDGYETEATEDGATGLWRVWLPAMGEVFFRESALTDVPPPLPPEPPPGFYLMEWEFLGRPHRAVVERPVDSSRWEMLGPGVPLDWADLLATYPGATLTRLVPAPEPVTLPWRPVERSNVAVKVDPSDPTAVCVMWGTYAHGFTPEFARLWGHALLSAADQAERAS